MTTPNQAQPKDVLFDVRVQEHALRRGEITHAQLQDHLEALPDDAAEAIPCHVTFTSPVGDRAKRRR